MSRQLEPKELFCFGFSYFDCQARRYHCNGGGQIEVTITLFQGMRWGFVIPNPTLTVDEIKELTAYRILDQMECYSQEVRNFAKQVRKESCPL